MTVIDPTLTRSVPPHTKGRLHALPLRAGTRGSPLAMAQTNAFLKQITDFCPVMKTPPPGMGPVFEAHQIRTTGDAVQDRLLAEIGGKGLFSKEIHEALADGRIDFAVHSLKDLETDLPPGIVLACTMRRTDARDALILGPDCGPVNPNDPLAAIPHGGVLGTSSVRRQAQILHARPDLKVELLRGNVGSRLDKVKSGQVSASMLALGGMIRLGMADRADAVLDPDTVMVPAAGQGIVGITVRESDVVLRDLLAAIEDAEARAVSTAERALLAALDGSCRTPVGGYAQVQADGSLKLTGLVAREDGSFMLKRSVQGAVADAARMGNDLGRGLRKDSPADIFQGA